MTVKSTDTIVSGNCIFTITIVSDPNRGDAAEPYNLIVIMRVIR